MEHKKWWDQCKSSLWFIILQYEWFSSKLVAQSTLEMAYAIKNQTLQLAYAWKKNIDMGKFYLKRCIGPNICNLCYSNVETLDHLKDWCLFTQYVRLQVKNLLHISQPWNYKFVHMCFKQWIKKHFPRSLFLASFARRYGSKGTKEYLKVRKT